jgi:CheY-like chemotaxis protein
MLGLLADVGLVACALAGGGGAGYALRAWQGRTAPPQAAASVTSPLAGSSETVTVDRATIAFLANISHEIRTPLNGVLAIADVLNRTGLTPQQQHLVSVMLNAGQSVNDVLNRLIELAEPNAVAKPAPAAAPVQPDIEPEESHRALIVDDNAINRQVIEMILDTVGVEYHSVENGLEAVEAARKERFPVVLMDLQMPVMDGFEATRQIRDMEARRGGPRASIIVVSANCLDEHIAAGRAAGADDHMAKPISAAALIAAISEPPEQRAAA